MKLYIVLEDWDYDGMSHPLAVFSNLKVAKAYARKVIGKNTYYNVLVSEYELDNAQTEHSKVVYDTSERKGKKKS